MKYFAQSLRPSEWQTWDLDPGICSPIPHYIALEFPEFDFLGFMSKEVLAPGQLC